MKPHWPIVDATTQLALELTDLWNVEDGVWDLGFDDTTASWAVTLEWTEHECGDYTTRGWRFYGTIEEALDSAIGWCRDLRVLVRKPHWLGIDGRCVDCGEHEPEEGSDCRGQATPPAESDGQASEGSR